MSSKNDFVEQMRQRTNLFAVRSIHLFQTLPKTEEARILGKQFLRSATSVGANYRAVCRARSKAEFFSKLSITIEEADETQFWVELFIESQLIPEQNVSALYKEATEIVAILTKARSSAQS
jgi:four helix bundle protein